MTSVKQNQAAQPPNHLDPRPRYVDNAGHIDPAHARRLRKLTTQSRRNEDEDHAFVDHPRTLVEMAETFGEQSVVNMTSGEQETVASVRDGGHSAAAHGPSEGDLDSTLWERELSADSDDVLEDLVSPDDTPSAPDREKR